MHRRLESLSIMEMTDMKRLDQDDVETLVMDGILDIVMDED
jgi:hypothetical protein